MSTGSSAEQRERYLAFRDLHATQGGFVMPNAWDACSAALLRREGFSALGSSSFAVACAVGVQDGVMALGRGISIDNAALLSRASGLPVNGDLENAFGSEPDDCVATVNAAVDAGLAGLGIEDTTGNPGDPIYGFDHAVRRIKAAAAAAKGRIVLTARTDNFLKGLPDLEDTVRRLSTFAEAGADVLYAPGLPTLEAIATVVRAVAPKPVNVLLGPTHGPVPISLLRDMGVKRISVGGALYRRVMGEVSVLGRLLSEGDVTWAKAGAPLIDPQESRRAPGSRKAY